MIDKLKNFGEREFQFQINLYGLMAFCFFWSYGFYGSVSSSENISLQIQIFLTIFLTIVFVYLLFLQYKKNDLHSVIQLKVQDLCLILFFLLFLFIYHGKSLAEDLTGDQLYHAQRSQLHITVFLQKLFKSNIIAGSGIVKDFITITSLSLISITAGLWILISRLEMKYKILFYTLLFLAFRSVILMQGGYNDFHPPFRTFPFWFFSSLFGMNDFSFRIPQVFILSWIMFLIFKKTYTLFRLNGFVSILGALGVGTIPILSAAGTVAEFSIYGTLGFFLGIFCILEFSSGDESRTREYIAALSILSLIRQPVFIVLVVVVALVVIERIPKIQNYEKFKIFIKYIFVLCIPIFIFIPYIIRTLLVGYGDGGKPFIFHSRSYLLMKSIENFESFKIVFRHLEYYVLFFPLLIIKRKDFNLYFYFILLLFLAGYFLFYTIPESLWGFSRYQAEYALPFFATGMLLIPSFFSTKLKNIVGSILFIVLIVYNIQRYNNLDELNPGNRNIRVKSMTIIAENVFSYKEIFHSIRKNGWAGKELLVGVSYGVLPQILAGYNFTEVRDSFALYKNTPNLFTNLLPADIEKNKNIKIILLSDTEHEKFIKGLSYYGWKKWLSFENKKNKTIIESMVRPDQL